MKTAQDLIQQLELKPHPEGGFYNEIYRSPEMLNAAGLPNRYRGDRCFGTSIYFLLRSQDISRFHRLQSDEIWHFYAGSSVTMHLLDTEHNHHTKSLGRDIESGEQLQFCVPKQTWFGATVETENSYALVGCTMAPGFDFGDFELAERKTLLSHFPAQRAIIEQLT